MRAYHDSFMKLLAGDYPDSWVWTADISYWLSSHCNDNPPGIQNNEDYLRLCGDLHIMPYSGPDGAFWAASRTYGNRVKGKTTRCGNSTRNMWETPIGSIADELRFAPGSHSTAHTRYAVSSKQDLEVLLWMMEKRTFLPCNAAQWADRVDLYRRYDGVPGMAFPRSTIPALMYEWAGVLNSVYLINDYPHLVERLAEIMSDQERSLIGTICELKPPIVHFAENLSSDNMAGLYRELMEPCHRERISHFHKDGIPCAVHLDGVVSPLLSMLADVGFDAIEALTPSPAGDTEIDSMRAMAGSNRLILWGGIPGAMFAPPYTWEDMRAHVLKAIDAWNGTRCVLGNCIAISLRQTCTWPREHMAAWVAAAQLQIRIQYARLV